ncbi:MAG TPA: hypothetical protein VIR60_03725 [Gammaproteobacteria bacterium]
MAGLLMAGMGGCSREEPAEDLSDQAQSDQLPADNVFSDQVEALDKAKDVQNTLDSAAVRTRESVERQERP